MNRADEDDRIAHREMMGRSYALIKVTDELVASSVGRLADSQRIVRALRARDLRESGQSLGVWVW